MKIRKRLLAVVLSSVMAFSGIAAGSFAVAAEAEYEQAEVESAEGTDDITELDVDGTDNEWEDLDDSEDGFSDETDMSETSEPGSDGTSASENEGDTEEEMEQDSELETEESVDQENTEESELETEDADETDETDESGEAEAEGELENSMEETTSDESHVASDVTNQASQLKLNLGNAWYQDSDNGVISLEELSGMIDYSTVENIATVGFDVLYRVLQEGSEREIHAGDWYEITLPDIATNVRLNSGESYGSDVPADILDIQINGNTIKAVFKENIEDTNITGIHGVQHIAFEVNTEALTESVSSYTVNLQEGNTCTLNFPAQNLTEETTEIDTEKIEQVKNLFQSLLIEFFAFESQQDDSISDEEVYEAIYNSIATMDEDTLNRCLEQTMEAMDAFDTLSYEEAEYFIETEAGLYHIVMELLTEILGGAMSGEISPMSLLPLEEQWVYLELDGYTKEKLEQFPLMEMLSLLQYEDGDYVELDGTETTVWKYEGDDISGIENYIQYDITEDSKINLYPEDGASSFQFEIIVGNGGQLNPDNKRYIVKAHLNDDFELDLQLEFYVQKEDGTREQAIPSNCNYWVGTYTFDGGAAVADELNYDVSFAGSLGTSLGDQGDVRLNLKSELAQNPRVRVEIYPVMIVGSAYITIKVPITSQILNQNMNDADSGYPFLGERNTDVTFNVVTYVDEEEYSNQYLCIRYWNWYPAHVGTLFTTQDNSRRSVASNLQTDFDSRNDVSTLIFTMDQGFSADAQYYFDYDFVQQKNYGDGDETNYDIYVKKIVIGHYDSIEEAEAVNAEDVTDSVLSNGFLANYGGDGIDFTVFKHDRFSSSFPLPYDTIADKITVQAVENTEGEWREFTEAPIIGEADPWFRVTGVKDTNKNVLDTYIIENGKNINMDTMYGYGYQTVFINEDVNTFVPIIEYADTEAVSVEKIFVNGSPFIIGDALSFSEGENILEVAFNLSIVDEAGSHQDNYVVRFVKRTSGPQLYVAGPLAPEIRSVFLDEYFEYKHDIFVANMGDEPLTDLRVELDATNVVLDPYWTIGGEGNNTLAACPDNFQAAQMESEYGELPNVAKIRLVPDGEKSGEIEGTLKIYSGNDLLATINLSGRAQNPKIVTEDLEDAVKYVPYSYMITTNNMYDWNSVNFSMDGALPDGMTFNENTGEIYGAPLKEGTYTFTVRADYGRSDYFEPSVKEFAITVLDNENETVFNTSDSGYAIIPSEDGESGFVGEQVSDYDFVVTAYEDDVFISEGEYGQFVKLWLNGEILVEGTDYTKEPGSTKITIMAQTLQNKTEPGRNTISAEYNIDGERGDKLKRTSQNFRIEIKQTEKDPTPSPGTGTTPGTEDTPGTENTPGTESNPGTESTPGVESTPVPSTPAGTNSSTQSGGNTTVSMQTPTGTASDSAAVSNSVTMRLNVVDEKDGPMTNTTIELHSTPKTAVTDSAGNAAFTDVEFGTHTVYVKNADGAVLASRSFELVSGNSVSINGDRITALKGSDITLKIKIVNGEIHFESIVLNSYPETGDDTNAALWVMVLLLCLFEIFMVYTKLQRRRA